MYVPTYIYIYIHQNQIDIHFSRCMPTLEYLAVATISNKNVDMKCSENNIDYLIEII